MSTIVKISNELAGRPIVRIAEELQQPDAAKPAPKATAPAGPGEAAKPAAPAAQAAPAGNANPAAQMNPEDAGKDPSQGYHDINMLIAELQRIKANPHAQEVGVKTEKKGNVRTFTVTVTTPDMLAGAQAAGMANMASSIKTIKTASADQRNALVKSFPKEFLKSMGIN